MTYIGADGCSGGWIAAEYSDGGYVRALFYDTIKAFYDKNADAT